MIDSHVHLDDRAYEKDRERILTGLEEEGLDLIVNIGCDLATSKASVLLARDYERVFATVGVHPHEAKTYDEDVEEQLKMLAGRPEVVAIGEIGLDYHYDNSPRDVQQAVFRRQLALAQAVDLPVVIHSREAERETLAILREAKETWPELSCLIHCYSYDRRAMREFLDMGFSIALGGATTFKNAKEAREVAREVPLDRLLLETDGPYLTPEPFRGKRNEPKHVRLVSEQIAQVRGMDVEALIEATDANTRAFYRMAP